MIKHFENLIEEEISLLLDTPVLIAILIAGADDKIDKKEIDWAEKMTHYRATKEDSILQDYYFEVEKYFKDSILDYINTLPDDYLERNHHISKKLEKLNEIMPKLDKKFAHEFYKNMLSFAKRVAESSGGIMGMAAISPAEQQWISLEMIKPPAEIINEKN